jgi:hypothetical protein
VFPVGFWQRSYELAVDSFWGPGETSSDHAVSTIPGTATGRKLSLEPGRRYWIRARAVATLGVLTIRSDVSEIGFRTTGLAAEPPPAPPIECC